MKVYIITVTDDNSAFTTDEKTVYANKDKARQKYDELVDTLRKDDFWQISKEFDTYVIFTNGGSCRRIIRFEERRVIE